MNENLISLKVLVDFGLSLSSFNMSSPEVSIIDSSIESEGNDLFLSIDFRRIDHCSVVLVMGRVGPGDRELRFWTQYFIIICKYRIKERAISILVWSQEFHNNRVEHLQNIIEDFTVCPKMQVMEVDLAGTDDFPMCFIVSVSLNTKFKSDA